MIVGEGLLMDFSHGLEATLSLLKEKGSVSWQDLGVELQGDFDFDGALEAALRERALAAIYVAAAAARARKGDSSRDFIPESVESSERLLFLGKVASFAHLLTDLDLGSLHQATLQSCPLVLVPRQAGSPRGIEAEFLPWSGFRDDLHHLVDEAIHNVHDVASPDFLVRGRHADLSSLLRFATEEERKRIVILSELDWSKGDVRQGFRYRGLVEGLLARVEKPLTSLGFGRLQRSDAGIPISWHYSASDDRALDAALLPLLGSSNFGVDPLGDFLLRHIKVATSCPPLYPEVLVIPSGDRAQLSLFLSSWPEVIVYDDANAELAHALKAPCPAYRASDLHSPEELAAARQAAEQEISR